MEDLWSVALLYNITGGSEDDRNHTACHSAVKGGNSGGMGGDGGYDIRFPIDAVTKSGPILMRLMHVMRMSRDVNGRIFERSAYSVKPLTSLTIRPALQLAEVSGMRLSLYLYELT